VSRLEDVTMHVLILGAGGFIGRHLAGRLMAEGVRVTAAGRDAARLERLLPGAAPVTCDLADDGAEIWRTRLVGIDAVVNCAGLIGDGAAYDDVHDRGPRALFDACRAAGVGRVIQISALGADAGAVTAYHRSKRGADDHLASIDPTGERMGWAVLRPSLVIGRGGQSSALFAALAALPLTPRLATGRWEVQPIYIDDLVETIVSLLRQPLPLAVRLDAVGPEPMTTDVLTAQLRRWLGLRPASVVPVPLVLLAAIARLGIGPVTRESLAMLVAGNIAPVAPQAAATGILPMTLDRAMARHPASDDNRRQARLAPVAPVLRGLLALTWLAGGIVPLLATPATISAAWLTHVGLTGPLATAALVGGSFADIVIGVTVLARVRGAAMAGIGLMAIYTAILAHAAPELWADPFGALVKNAAILGLSLAVHAMEVRRG
jgi:uncharacterized protein YbjT (DUF2867 family)